MQPFLQAQAKASLHVRTSSSSPASSDPVSRSGCAHLARIVVCAVSLLNHDPRTTVRRLQQGRQPSGIRHGRGGHYRRSGGHAPHSVQRLLAVHHLVDMVTTHPRGHRLGGDRYVPRDSRGDNPGKGHLRHRRPDLGNRHVVCLPGGSNGSAARR
jgi:hypothetical protein